jgi:hypothetical protein
MGKNLSIGLIVFAFIVVFFYPFFGVNLTNNVYYRKYYLNSSTFLTFPKDKYVVPQQQNYLLECFIHFFGCFSIYSGLYLPIFWYNFCYRQIYLHSNTIFNLSKKHKVVPINTHRPFWAR